MALSGQQRIEAGLALVSDGYQFELEQIKNVFRMLQSRLDAQEASIKELEVKQKQQGLSVDPNVKDLQKILSDTTVALSERISLLEELAISDSTLKKILDRLNRLEEKQEPPTVSVESQIPPGTEAVPIRRG